MKDWSWWVTFGFVLALLLLRQIRLGGLSGLLRSLRLWGEGVTPKQRRENLVGLGIVLILGVLGILFWPAG